MDTDEKLLKLYNNHEHIIYTATVIGKLSSYIKKYNNTGIQKNVFYKLKWYFVKYLIDNCVYDNESIHIVDKDILYKFKVNSFLYNKDTNNTIYNIIFNLNGYIIDFNVLDNNNYITNLIKKHIDPICLPLLENDNISNLYITEDSVYKLYSGFINWCSEHNWFFIPYNDYYTIYESYEFFLSLYKRANISIFTDPFAPSRKIMTRTPDVYIYRMKSNGEFEYCICPRCNLTLFLNYLFAYTKYNNDDPFKKYYKKNGKIYTLYKVNESTGINTKICEDYVKERLIAKQNLLMHYNRYNNINEKYIII